MQPQVVTKFDVALVFRARHKLEILTGFSRVRRECLIKHKNPAVSCEEGVVYSIPLKCGFPYIGQTGCCLNLLNLGA